VDLSEPANLTLYTFNSGLTDEEFQQFFTDPLKKKFPQVTLKKVKGEKTGATAPENILASGENPDLIFTGPVSIPVFTKLQMATDLNDFIKKNNMDLKQFEPSTIDSIKKHGAKGETYAIPYSMNFAALFYNKNIFDKFALSYPKEMITWDEVMELSRKLTRMDGGTQYYGFVPPAVNQLGNQLALPYVDPQSHKALLLTDQWNNVFKLYKQFLEVPGMVDANGKAPNIRKSFLEQKTMAMIADWANGIIPPLEEAAAKGDSLSWDLTTYPSFTGHLGKSRNPTFAQLMISATSKHQALDFEIMKFAASDEIQKLLTQNGRLTVLDNDALQKQFGSNYKSLSGKNLTAALKSKPVPIANPTDYDDVVVNVMKAADDKLATPGTDINTLLRETQEAANKAIAEAMGQ
jgi:multiple sugar transport system substrate-binding protein